MPFCSQTCLRYCQVGSLNLSTTTTTTTTTIPAGMRTTPPRGKHDVSPHGSMIDTPYSVWNDGHSTPRASLMADEDPPVPPRSNFPFAYIKATVNGLVRMLPFDKDALGALRRTFGWENWQQSLASHPHDYPQHLRFLTSEEEVETGELSPLLHASRQLQASNSRKGSVHNLPDAAMIADAKHMTQVLVEVGLGCGMPLYMIQFYSQILGSCYGCPVTCYVSDHKSVFLCYPPDSLSYMVHPASTDLSLSKLVDTTVLCDQVILHWIENQDRSGLAGVPERSESLHFPSRLYRWTTQDNGQPRVSARALATELLAIGARPKRWPQLQLCALYLLPGCIAPLFGCNLQDTLAALPLGCLAGFFTFWRAEHIYINRGRNVLLGLLCSVAAVLVNRFVQRIAVVPVMLSMLVWALPGMTINSAMGDFSVGFWLPGTAKLMAALLTTANMSFGVLIGLRLNMLLKGDLTKSPDPLPFGATLLSLVCSVGCLVVLVDAHLGHFPQLLLASALAYYGCQWAQAWIAGPYLGTFIGALLTGIAANLYGMFSQKPSVELSLFATQMLMPGSLGVRSVLAGDTLTTVGVMGELTMLGVCIVTGLMSSNLLIPLRRAI
eukprot:g77638.t1